MVIRTEMSPNDSSHPSEVRSFITLMVALGAVCAILNDTVISALAPQVEQSKQ